jgi:copper(I)-binding protein
MTAPRLVLALALVAAAAAPASAKWQPKPKPSRMTEVPVSVTDAWIREAPPGASAMAAYMLVVNPSKKGLNLTRVTSPAFGEVQMHVSEVKDGMTRMKQVPGFSLPAGAKLVFKPGGNHLMLLKPKKALKQGDVVPLVLEFDKAGVRSLQVKVLAQGITGDTPHH